MASVRHIIATPSQVHEDDLEEISLFEPSHSGSSGSAETYSSPSSISSADSACFSSMLSTPTLISDASSLRSSLSSVSSPALVNAAEHFTRQGIQFTNAVSKENDVLHSAMGNKIHTPDIQSLTDKTSMASLSRVPTLRMRSRKQREQDFDNDKGEDFWPADGLMFNVPMSPALYAQQKLKKQQLQRGQQPHHSRTRSALNPTIANSRRLPSPPREQNLPVNGKPRHPQILPTTRRRSSTRANSLGLPSIREAGARSAAKNIPAVVGLEDLDSDARVLTLAYANQGSFSFDHRRSHSAGSKGDDQIPHIPKRMSQDSVSSMDSDKLPAPGPLSSPRRTSLTRPEHLPPKTVDEERKHLDEYDKLMASAAEHERKRQEFLQQQRQERENQMKADLTTWQEWLRRPTSTPFKRLRQLWWRGIPPKIRAQVWVRQAGNTLGVCLDEQPLGGKPDEIAKSSVEVWPELGIFGPGRPLHNSLVHVVQAFLGLHPGIRYQRGLGLIAGLLLLELEEDDAFVVLANMLQNSLPLAVYGGDEQTTAAHYSTFFKVFRSKFSRLNDHFNTIRLAPQQYLDGMMASLFADRLDVETAAHIVDVFLFEKDGFLLRAAMGLLLSCEASLYQSRREVLDELRSPVKVSDEVLFKRISEVTSSH